MFEILREPASFRGVYERRRLVSALADTALFSGEDVAEESQAESDSQLGQVIPLRPLSDEASHISERAEVAGQQG